MKKILITAALLALIPTAAQALECEISTSVADERQTLSLDITGDRQFENIAVRILKPDSVVTEDTDSAEFIGMLTAAGTVTADAELKAARTFTLSPDIDEGNYIIDLKSDSGVQKSVEYYLYSYNTITETLSCLRTETDASKVTDAIVDYGSAVGIDAGKLLLLDSADRPAAAELFIKNRPDEAAADVSSLQTALDEAVMVVRIRAAGGAAAVFEEYEPALGLTNDEIYKKYLAEADSAGLSGWYQRISAQAKNAENTADLQEIAREQLLLHIIDYGGVWYTTKSIITDNYALLGLTSSDIKGAADKVYQNVNGREYSDKTAFSVDFLKEKKSAAASVTTSGSSSPSGGASSSSSSNIYAIADSTPDITSAQPDKTASVFDDVQDKAPWAAEAVGALRDKGVVSGKSETEFAPNDNVTREEFTAMVVNMCGIEAGQSSELFEDVSADSWYARYVSAAYEQGIVSGIDNNRFGAGQNITRQDMAVIIARAIGAEGAQQADFADGGDIAEYARDSVSKLFALGIISGKEENRFCPRDNATRAEAAQMIYMAMKYKQWI